MTTLLSDENATDVTAYVWSDIETLLPVTTSQTQTVLSPEPDAICFPSDDMDTEYMAETCPVSHPTCVLVSTLHIRIVQSLEPETKSFPSGEKMTDSTESKWPFNKLDADCGFIKSHSRTELSSDPDAI